MVTQRQFFRSASGKVLASLAAICAIRSYPKIAHSRAYSGHAIAAPATANAATPTMNDRSIQQAAGTSQNKSSRSSGSSKRRSPAPRYPERLTIASKAQNPIAIDGGRHNNIGTPLRKTAASCGNWNTNARPQMETQMENIAMVKPMQAFTSSSMLLMMLDSVFIWFPLSRFDSCSTEPLNNPILPPEQDFSVVDSVSVRTMRYN